MGYGGMRISEKAKLAGRLPSDLPKHLIEGRFNDRVIHSFAIPLCDYHPYAYCRHAGDLHLHDTQQPLWWFSEVHINTFPPGGA